MDSRVLMLGDAAFTIEFPELSGAMGAKRVRELRTSVQEKIDQGELTGIIDLISATRSLSICLDPMASDFSKIRDAVYALAATPSTEETLSDRLWTLPACYHGDYAPDMNEVSQQSGITVDEVIQLHSETVYDVLLIGFLPGFPFMSKVPEKLRFPRRTSPRLRVPAGSVAVANDQTAVYPWESPGGWHLLARCPIPLFNPNWESASLLSPGEYVRFEPVSVQDYQTIEADIASGLLSPHSLVSEQGIR